MYDVKDSIFRLFQHSHGKWPMYRCVLMIWARKMVILQFTRIHGLIHGVDHVVILSRNTTKIYPPVNVYIAVETDQFFMGKFIISMTIFNSYVRGRHGIYFFKGEFLNCWLDYPIFVYCDFDYDSDGPFFAGITIF